MKQDLRPQFWSYFDKIYCISLEDRIDRREQAQKAFDAAGLSHQVEFVVAKRNHRDCERGIYESHRNCIRKGIDAGAQTIVVFEDDIAFGRIDPETLKNCIDFMDSNADWQVFFFGCLVSGVETTAYPSIVKIHYSSLAHGYVINRKFARMIVDRPWQGIPFDTFVKSMQNHYYAVYPMIAFQSNSPTDNDKHLLLDRVRRLCGGLCWIQKVNVYYHRYRRVMLLFQIILLVMGGLIFWVLY